MIAASIAILSSAAVVSTGFAAWVISGGDTKNVSGTITADTVTESYHTIAFTSETTASIYFGGPTQETDVTDPWLTNTSAGKESLLAEFTFTVANVKTGEDTPTALFSSITLSGADDANYSAAATANLVSALPTSWSKNAYDTAAPAYDSKAGTRNSGIYLVKTSGEANNKGATFTFTLYIQFTWGSEFGNKNPFYFYNVKGKTAAANGTDAKNKLDKVADINDAKFNLTITTK